MNHLGRKFSIERREGYDGRLYWIAIDEHRNLVVNTQGQWVNLLSVDADHARFSTLSLLEVALDFAEGRKAVLVESAQIVPRSAPDSAEIRYRQVTVHQVMNRVMAMIDAAPPEQGITVIIARQRQQENLGVQVVTTAIVSKRGT